jgi:hypothetical protein
MKLNVPERNRTVNLRIRNPLLYPVELREPFGHDVSHVARTFKPLRKSAWRVTFMSGCRQINSLEMMPLIILVAIVLLSATACAAVEEAPVVAGPQVLDPAHCGIGRVVEDLNFTDAAGVAGKFSDFAAQKALVVLLTSADCPLSKKYAPTINALHFEYKNRNIAFLLLNSAHDSKDAVAGAIERNKFEMRYAVDADGSVARSLNAQTTTEVFVLDSSRRLIYRGCIDDQYGLGYEQDKPRHEYLRKSLDALLTGVRPEVTATSAPGCELALGTIEETKVTATWHKEISRLVQKSCVDCHRTGGNAPFPLTDYENMKRKRNAVRRVVKNRSMPPWHADHMIGGPWANNRRLSDEDQALLLNWLEAGAAEGDPRDAPAPRTFTEEWQIGKPDVIVQIPNPVKIPATGRLGYQYIDVKLNFPEDRWVSAIEMRPTQPELVHHSQVFVSFNGKLKIEQSPSNGGRPDCYFGAMVPGDTYQIFPKNSAKLLPKGASLKFEIHYVPNGVAAEDQMRVGLIFAKERPEFEVRSFDIRNSMFNIPPGADGKAVSTEYAFPKAARLLSFQPHMHLRGKSFKVEALYADGKSETVLSVPRYNFNWQTSYRPLNPIEIPGGTKIKVTGWFDNSANNPANPDPNVTVNAGAETTDEMLVCFGEWHEIPEPKK